MKPKIALVHDFLLYWGGAESVLKNLAELYPGAPIYTLLKNDELVKKYFADNEVQASFLEKFPAWWKKRHKLLFPMMPSAVESFDLREYDLVISSSSAFAKGIVVKSKIPHVCYMHAPMRYVWDWGHEYLEEQRLKGKSKLMLRFFLNYLRMWDRASAQRPDHLIANSKYTAQRIQKYYRREAEVIYPPVNVEKFTAQKENEGYFLTVGRLSAYKRVDLIIDVFKKLNLPLVIVGDGQERERLQKMVGSGDQIRILGWMEDEKLVKLYQNARAFVCASVDDFNITAVEAMAAGKPVIALRQGGVTEIVIEGETGEFFDSAKMEIAADGVRRFIENENNYDHLRIRQRAEKFSKERFQENFISHIDSLKVEK